MSRFHKLVSTIEKLYLAYNKLRPPFVNQFVVEGRGRAPLESLKAAIARSSAVNPGSALRIGGSLGRMAWVPGPEPDVVLVHDASWDGRSEKNAQFLERQLDPERGPTCDVLAIESREHTHLVFRSLHAVMDGLGTRLWAEDVLRAMRGEAPIGYPSAMTDTEFAAGLTQEKLILPARDARTPLGKADAPSSGNDFVWRRVELPWVDGVPIVAALAVTLAAETRRNGEAKVRLNIPADLRFFRPDERTTGNAIGTLLLEVPPDATIESVSNELKTRLRAREHARFPSIYGPLRWLPMSAMEGLCTKGFSEEHVSGLYSLSATISYLGAVDAQALRFPGFTPTNAFFIPPTADQPCFVVVSRFGDSLNLLLCTPRVFSTGGRFESLFDRLCGALARGANAA